MPVNGAKPVPVRVSVPSSFTELAELVSVPVEAGVGAAAVVGSGTAAAVSAMAETGAPGGEVTPVTTLLATTDTAYVVPGLTLLIVHVVAVLPVVEQVSGAVPPVAVAVT